MKKTKALVEEKLFMVSLEDIVVSFEEISAIKTRQIKKGVLYNRNFLEGLNQAYAYVAYSQKLYKKELKAKDAQDANKTTDTVRVLLATNTGLFGSLVRNTFELFVSDVEEGKKVHNRGDLIVIGKMGVTFMSAFLPLEQYTYFDLSDMSDDETNTKAIFSQLSKYTDIIVYHGIFKSILRQDSVKTFVLGQIERIKEELSSKKSHFNFLFEPSITEVSSYFETQIRLLLFEQTLSESSLSKYASRMVALNDARDRISDRRKHVDNTLNKLDHKRRNVSLFANYFRNTLW